MPKSELLTEYEKFCSQLEDEESRKVFAPFLAAVKAADDAMGLLHRRDRYGRIPLLTQAHKQQLLTLHEALGAQAEALIAKADLPGGKKDAVRKLAALGAGNYRHLLAYDPAKPRSLPELLQDARTLTLDTSRMKDVRRVNGNQSSRQPLTFLDDKGREITGVFTPKKIADTWNSVKEGIAQAANGRRLSPLGRKFMVGLMDRLESPKGAEVLGLPPTADRSARLAAFYNRMFGAHLKDFDTEMAKVIAQLWDTPENPMDAAFVRTQLDKEGLLAIGYAVDPYGTAILNNNVIAKIHDGARMDSRNAAMSAVAELLNVPNLLAKSVPMKVVDAGGNVVEGTFMMEAKGVDMKNISMEQSEHDKRSLRNHNGKAMKSVADLQVLDFICGNTDRHGSNATYQFVGNNFDDVQGFDNDTAFGALVPKKGDFVAFLTHPEHMMGISQSMYERLNQLTPETLKFTLRGFDLTEEELDAACTRMQMIKDVVQRDKSFFQEKDAREAEMRKGLPKAPQDPARQQKTPSKMEFGRLRVMKDEDWKKESWENMNHEYTYKRYHKGVLTTMTAQANFFSMANRNVCRIRRAYDQQEQDYMPLRSDQRIRQENRAIPTNMISPLKTLRVLDREMTRKTDGNRTSQPFEEMHESVKRFRQFYENLYQRVSDARTELKNGTAPPERELDAIITLDDLNQIQNLHKDLEKTAAAYLGTKNLKLWHTTYTQDRIDLGKMAFQFGRSGTKITEEESETSFRNEREIMERTNRRIGDTLEAEGWKPDQPQKPAEATM